jgi:release factor glutamine methyltransferase
MSSGLPVGVKYDPSLEIDIPSEVYNPSDDSFLLLKVVEVDPGESFLEIGCGSGLTSAHAAKAGARVTATDISPHAVEVTRRNAAKNDLRITVLESDLFEKVVGNFDIIAFNAPYLPEERLNTSWIESAWAGGTTGNEVIIRFLGQAWKHLTPGGRIYLIISSLSGITSVLKAAKEKYTSELVEEKRMFFESIFAYRLALKTRSENDNE